MEAVTDLEKKLQAIRDSKSQYVGDGPTPIYKRLTWQRAAMEAQRPIKDKRDVV